MKETIRKQLEDYVNKQKARLETLKKKEVHSAVSGGYILAHETVIRIMEIETTISRLESILN